MLPSKSKKEYANIVKACRPRFYCGIGDGITNDKRASNMLCEYILGIAKD